MSNMINSKNLQKQYDLKVDFELKERNPEDFENIQIYLQNNPKKFNKDGLIVRKKDSNQDNIKIEYANFGIIDKNNLNDDDKTSFNVWFSVLDQEISKYSEKKIDFLSLFNSDYHNYLKINEKYLKQDLFYKNIDVDLLSKIQDKETSFNDLFNELPNLVKQTLKSKNSVFQKNDKFLKIVSIFDLAYYILLNYKFSQINIDEDKFDIAIGINSKRKNIIRESIILKKPINDSIKIHNSLKDNESQGFVTINSMKSEGNEGKNDIPEIFKRIDSSLSVALEYKSMKGMKLNIENNNGMKLSFFQRIFKKSKNDNIQKSEKYEIIDRKNLEKMQDDEILNLFEKNVNENLNKMWKRLTFKEKFLLWSGTKRIPYFDTFHRLTIWNLTSFNASHFQKLRLQNIYNLRIISKLKKINNDNFVVIWTSTYENAISAKDKENLIFSQIEDNNDIKESQLGSLSSLQMRLITNLIRGKNDRINKLKEYESLSSKFEYLQGCEGTKDDEKLKLWLLTPIYERITMILNHNNRIMAEIMIYMLIEEFYDNFIIINRIERDLIKKTNNKIYFHYYNFAKFQSLLCGQDQLKKRLIENQLDEKTKCINSNEERKNYKKYLIEKTEKAKRKIQKHKKIIQDLQNKIDIFDNSNINNDLNSFEIEQEEEKTPLKSPIKSPENPKKEKFNFH